MAQHLYIAKSYILAAPKPIEENKRTLTHDHLPPSYASRDLKGELGNPEEESNKSAFSGLLIGVRVADCV